jgi:hypothetical protein
MRIDSSLKPADFSKQLETFWYHSGRKIESIEREYDVTKGSPVFTIGGRYTSRGWTEWTQGFQYGSAILQFDAGGDPHFLEAGRKHTLEKMAPHISHSGVHDHGFNNISTYGNLLRLMKENKIPDDPWERNFHELALKLSGAVQAGRWTKIRDGGFIYSFNGPHSLFVDTIRSCRILGLSHKLKHFLQSENDQKINLLDRMWNHLKATARYNIFYGEGRDSFDVPGRTAHECIFNVNDGNYRCTNAQQGYSGFTTWTRGLAWAMTGFAEELEFFETVSDEELQGFTSRQELSGILLKAAKATCDFYITNTPSDGIPYWDTGAPNLYKLGDYSNKPSDPNNDFEPVDSSAAAIGAQGLLRLGRYLSRHDDEKGGKKYFQAGLTVLKNLFDDPYLCKDPAHQGLILHSIYHRPNGWDHIPHGSRIPRGESSMWGDYHAREVALWLQRIIRNEPYYTYFNCI